MVIAVDFDGTIVEHRYPEIGEELPFATEVLKMLIADRHKVVLYTMRNGKLLEDAVKWCAERGVEFYAVNSDEPNDFRADRNTNYSPKVNADYFIDDRNISGLPDWTTIYKIISRGLTYEQILRKRIREAMSTVNEPPVPKWMFWKSSKR
jgi:hypothetical protein